MNLFSLPDRPTYPHRAFTMLEVTLVLGLLVLTFLVLVSRNVSVETAGDDRAAQGAITATLGELHLLAQPDGALPTDLSHLGERLPGYTIISGGNVSDGPDSVSVAVDGARAGLAAVGGRGDCWLVVRDLDAPTPTARSIIAVSDTVSCTGNAALLLTPDPVGERGTSFDTPLTQ